MKKIKAAFILSIIFLLQGCTPLNVDKGTTAQSGEPTQSEAVTEQTEIPATELHVSDLFEIKDNLTLTYRGDGNEFASMTIYTDYTDGDRVQRRVDNGATVVLEVLQVKDGTLTRLLSVPEGYYRENLIPSSPDEGEVLLMEPVRKGTSWTLSDGRVRTITDTAAKITTPSGIYTAVEVTTTDSESTVKDYYAPGTGLVKTVFGTGEGAVSSVLEKADTEGSFIQRINFFYPASDGKIYYVTKELSFKTNDVTRLRLSDIYRTVPDSSFSQVFPADTSMQSLYLNKDGMVYVDLSPSFAEDMNAGAETESLILQSVADTVGMYYGVDKIILTVDNKPFSSGHIEMKVGEYLSVSENAVQWER
ncbi:MAG: GerMN domain-containing protein [Eubacteriales bacterium]